MSIFVEAAEIVSPLKGLAQGRTFALAIKDLLHTEPEIRVSFLVERPDKAFIYGFSAGVWGICGPKTAWPKIICHFLSRELIKDLEIKLDSSKFRAIENI